MSAVRIVTLQGMLACSRAIWRANDINSQIKQTPIVTA